MFNMVKINNNINKICIVISESSLEESEKKRLSLFLFKVSAFFSTINNTSSVLANLNFYSKDNIEH